MALGNPPQTARPKPPGVTLCAADGWSAVAASPSLFHLVGCPVPHRLLPNSSCLLHCLGVNRLGANRLPIASVSVHTITGLHIHLPIASLSGRNIQSLSRPVWPLALQRSVQQAPDALNTYMLVLTQLSTLTLFDKAPFVINRWPILAYIYSTLIVLCAAEWSLKGPRIITRR